MDRAKNILSQDKPYDYLIIDETQDLSPVSIRMLVELVRNTANILLLADLSQSIYNRSFSFRDIHEALKIVGRTRILRHNYRTTAEIMAGAVQFLEESQAGDTETIVQKCVRFGPKPILTQCWDESDHIRKIVDYIIDSAIDLALPPGAAAILCPTNEMAKQAAMLCTKHNLPARYMKSNEVQLEIPEVKVMTMHAAKGLEFPIVVIPFVQRGVIPKELPSNSLHDVENFEASQRRLLFVAASRAMRRLIVTTGRDENVSPFCIPLTDRHWNRREFRN